ncbi:hypothetical protein [Anaerococcus lactolyticus]|uniref:Uncharacterized protein n=1 Tax=Anaerococcus lactolyticus S7-1-13 TaxID=1284686 RepID=A0A095X2U8_9FIRM|nr:hypothetical protein [Anaerococcus lactolyticus]KGF04365.1 hypothetical protein HMPREF1630_04090 [Anaerococcus lactolyticus S7-1-13]
MSNNKSFLSFLDELAEEIQAGNEKKGKIQKPLFEVKKSPRKKSIIGYLNDLVENMELDQYQSQSKPDIEAQRRLKSELRTKHAEKFKKPEEGDTAALKRLKEAEQKEKTDKIREEMAKEKNRKRLKDAIIMAEILGPPVSKRR